MRNIKLRQRNLNNGLHYYWGLVDGIWQNPKIQDNYIHPMDSEQYIDLKDKNNVEIYETDRISFIKTYNNKRYVGEVRYVKEVGGYMLCAMNNEPWHSFEFGLGTVELEVLGE
ncbi:MAG: hypothetical protein KAS66_07555 [Candidatus Omnitrophica bacterium]|nr:hypothetical protein [Candidatus Omnitrophota bacterium]